MLPLNSKVAVVFRLSSQASGMSSLLLRCDGNRGSYPSLGLSASGASLTFSRVYLLNTYVEFRETGASPVKSFTSVFRVTSSPLTSSTYKCASNNIGLG